jgi:hypothetical protein
MNHSESAKLSAAGRKAMQAKIEAYTAKYRPKVISIKDGVKIIEAACADGANSVQWVKPSGRGNKVSGEL